MISQRSRGLHYLLCSIQIVFTILSFWAYAGISEGETLRQSGEFTNSYIIYSCFLVFGLLVEMFSRNRMEIRANLFGSRSNSKESATLRQIIFALAALMLFLVATHDQTISRFFLFSYLFILYAILSVTNLRLPDLLARLSFKGIRTEKTLLIGSRRAALKLKDWLQHKSRLGFQTIGLLTDERNPLDPGVPILGTTEEMEDVVPKFGVTQIILLELPSASHSHDYLHAVCERHGVRLHILSDLEEIIHHPVTFVEDGGFSFISLREEPLENPLNRTKKRLLDIAVSLPVILFILPIASALVWIAQLFQSRGPLFYKQMRAGIQNQQFEIWKYRTMRSDNMEIAKQASQNDDRIYSAGKIFRKLSIDELPQFWNVLKGDMSVVGPRPHLVEHNKIFADMMLNYQVRAFVKPGITGLAQVRGHRGEARSKDDIQHRLESDIQYLENWSFSLDCIIIFRTAWQMLFPPKSAY